MQNEDVQCHVMSPVFALRRIKGKFLELLIYVLVGVVRVLQETNHSEKEFWNQETTMHTDEILWRSLAVI